LLPAGAILTGGGAKLRGIVDTAKAILRLPIQIGFPAETGGIIEEVDDPSYATPIGTIVWQLEHGAVNPSKMKFDFSGISQNMHKMKDWLKNLLP
jgi:cell division protein FtsA